MTHSDDKGLVLPPTLAPFQIVLVPLYRNEEEMARTVAFSKTFAAELKAKGIRVKVDDDDTKRPGWKFAEWEMKGVPLRIAIGSRDLDNNQLEFARRDTSEKSFVPVDERISKAESVLNEIQINLFKKAADFRTANSHQADSYEEFKTMLETKGGFIWAHWDGTKETAEKVQEETKATIRCIPEEGDMTPGKCMVTGKASERRVIFAKAY